MLEHGRHIVASLIADGGPDALEAAEMVAKGESLELDTVALTPAQRDAILAVLENPPAGLEDLRGALARDRQQQ